MLVFINSCDLPIDPIGGQILEILDIQVDYNVNTEQLYIGSKINHFEQVHLIWATFYLSNSLDKIGLKQYNFGLDSSGTLVSEIK